MVKILASRPIIAWSYIHAILILWYDINEKVNIIKVKQQNCFDFDNI